MIREGFRCTLTLYGGGVLVLEDDVELQDELRNAFQICLKQTQHAQICRQTREVLVLHAALAPNEVKTGLQQLEVPAGGTRIKRNIHASRGFLFQFCPFCVSIPVALLTQSAEFDTKEGMRNVNILDHARVSAYTAYSYKLYLVN